MSELVYRRVEVQGNAPPWGDVEMPGYVIREDDGLTLLSWHNTMLRAFKDDRFNHIEYHPQPLHEQAEGDFVIGSLSQRLGGILIDGYGEELASALLEDDFPQRYDPLVDHDTFNWYTSMHARLGAAMLEEFLNEPRD